jgi:hypothetical protein
LARLPSKKVIWLVIVLVVITIASFWYVGSKTKKDSKEKLSRYYQEITEKENNLETVINNANLSSNKSSDFSLKTNSDWSSIEVNINQDVSAKALKQYGLDLGLALNTFSTQRTSEIKATFQALDKKDPTELKKVVNSRIIHEEAVAKLKLISVPKDLVGYHQQLINSLQNSTQFLSLMEKALEQPESALEASRLFVQESILFHQIMQKLSNYLTSQQIQFSDNEKARVLFEF